MQLGKASSVIKEDAELLVHEMGSSLDPLAGTTMLISGAGGFLCSFLLDVIAAYNRKSAVRCKVIALDNFQSGVPERIEHLQADRDITFVKHDMREPFIPASGQVDWIIHGASIASPPFYRKFPLETIDVNVNGTRHLLDLCRQGAKSMLHLSTSEVYGDPDPRFVPTAESYLGNVSCTGPRACYDESKRLAETLCSTYFRLYALPIKVGRPFNVYGPGQRIDDGRIIPDMMQCALRGEALTLYSDGKASRSFCYIRDAAKAILLILLSKAEGEVFNLGNDEVEVSMATIATTMSKVAGPPELPVVFQTNSDAHYTTDNPQRRCPDLTKLRSVTGFNPTVSLEEGLSRTLASYRELMKDLEKECV